MRVGAVNAVRAKFSIWTHLRYIEAFIRWAPIIFFSMAVHASGMVVGLKIGAALNGFVFVHIEIGWVDGPE
jgi:hypothetical protein